MHSPGIHAAGMRRRVPVFDIVFALEDSLEFLEVDCRVGKAKRAHLFR